MRARRTSAEDVELTVIRRFGASKDLVVGDGRLQFQQIVRVEVVVFRLLDIFPSELADGVLGVPQGEQQKMGDSPSMRRMT